MKTGVYDFSVKLADGNPVELSQYSGKVSLVVNSASKDVYSSQLLGLENLYRKYKEQGFILLLFPCNQFQLGEPGGDREVERLYRESFGITAPIFAKINVNGTVSDRLYRHLTEAWRYDRNHPVPAEMETSYRNIDSNYQTSSDIKWSFTKFLIDRDGRLIKRFEPEVAPETLEQDIIEALIS